MNKVMSAHEKAFEKVALQFPILARPCRGKRLVYLDSGATTQKPQTVMDAMTHYYETMNANVHRGVYELGERATHAFEAVRDQVRALIHAPLREEIIFTAGTTAAINLVASSFGALQVKAGDEIVISTMEHHSNIVPWQLLCERVGAQLKVIPLLANGELDLAAYHRLINIKTRLVAVTHISNVLGIVNPLAEMIAYAHHHGVPVLVDGAQAIARVPVDVVALDCDFYVFSAHKMYGPTGVGVLYGKRRWLEAMPPYQGGGEMISRVHFDRSEFNVLPYKFEAGTPPIAEVIGMGAALDFLQSLGFTAIMAHEDVLMAEALRRLGAIPGVKIYGHAENKRGVISFTLSQTHPHDIATILDNEGIAIRAGHHCAMPLMTHYHVPAMARISFGVYNTLADVDVLLQGLAQVRQIFEE